MELTLRDRSAKAVCGPCECWIDRESSGCEFRDARLGDRFRKLLTQIGSAMGLEGQRLGRSLKRNLLLTRSAAAGA
ncbi:transposase DNA-binding-containing protein [Bradyrhizobium sp. STM 3562]|uniref:transposase DNA-binding-containing protein n=1 Tax=Bradyrhizobium sp. STM 3562 TaxID=578924 RepID=UPI00388FA2A5